MLLRSVLGNCYALNLQTTENYKSIFFILFIYLFILLIYKQYLYRLPNSAQAGLNGGLCTK